MLQAGGGRSFWAEGPLHWQGEAPTGLEQLRGRTAKLTPTLSLRGGAAIRGHGDRHKRRPPQTERGAGPWPLPRVPACSGVPTRSTRTSGWLREGLKKTTQMSAGHRGRRNTETQRGEGGQRPEPRGTGPAEGAAFRRAVGRKGLRANARPCPPPPSLTGLPGG